MGLFSPRKDGAPPSRSASDGSVIGKSRWFAVHRNSKVFDRDVSLTQHGVTFNSTSYIRPRSPSTSQESDHRSSTDRATLTLAQRLNGLAASNADGLLGDEDYRLLRQNLFERFGASSQLPTESPVVRLSPPESSFIPGSRNIVIPVDSSSRSSRPPSIASNSSRVSTITSALRNALRRSSSRAGNVYDPHEDSKHRDDISMASGPSGSLPRRLKHQSSVASFQSSLSSRPAMDARSISSYKTGLSSRTGRTSTSKGPPSSYHRPRRLPPQLLEPELDGEESSADIRAEIAAVELEKQQLMENFQGLELTAVSQQGYGMKSRSRSSSKDERPSSMWTITPGTHAGASRDPSPPAVPKVPPMQVMGPSVAERKRSLGMVNIASAKFSKSRDHIVTPPSITRPASPSTKPPKSGFFRRRTTQSSSVNPGQQASPPPRAVSESAVDMNGRSTTPGGNQSQSSLIPEANILVGIQQRKVETAARYDQRLEFLRARLKGAELKERLIR